MSEMERLDQTSTRALQMLLGAQATTEAKVVFVWTIAAGPAMARAGRASWSAADGTFRVVARTAEWQSEIRRARPVIAARFAELLGADVVRRWEIDRADAATRSNTPLPS
jgi:hypothetical protein